MIIGKLLWPMEIICPYILSRSLELLAYFSDSRSGLFVALGQEETFGDHVVSQFILTGSQGRRDL